MPLRPEATTCEPNARIEALFGRFPPITIAEVDAAGFRNDVSLEALVRRSTQLG